MNENFSFVSVPTQIADLCGSAIKILLGKMTSFRFLTEPMKFFIKFSFKNVSVQCIMASCQ